MKHNNLKGSLLLTLAALIWGLAFVAQSDAAEHVPSFTFNALRSFIGAGALLLVYYIISRNHKSPFFPKEKDGKKSYMIAGLTCGTLLAFSVNFQQFGLSFYPDNAAGAARAGFITALYVIIVPIISFFFGKKAGPIIWVSAFIALVGFYLLCLSGGISGIYLGDIFVLLCAICFSLHIIAIDKFVGITGGVKLSILQFVVCGAISVVLSFLFEKPTMSGIITAAPQILYLGIMSSAVAYTLQIVGQRFAEPAVASISMSLESVFAALGGWLISGNSLSVRELFGCAIVFSAIIVAQLPDFLTKKQTNVPDN